METKALIDGIFARDRRALARAATLLENNPNPEWFGAVKARAGRARILGLTGPPGAGKSTFAAALLKEIRGQGLTAALIAVDPSSHRSGGAILGDRIRMLDHTADEGTFIRSMATRGQMGGLAPATHRLATLFDAAGFDVVLIETVGVGQDEIAVARLAQCVVVLFVPGQGDEIQAMKSGIMEIADVFVVNKADLPGAEKLYYELEAEAHGRAPVLKTVAIRNEGIAGVWQAIQKHQSVAAETANCLAETFPIDHLGIAVPSIDRAIAFWCEALGLPLAQRETVEREMVNVAMLPAGESRLELLEATSENSVIAKFIAQRGPGLHHIAIRVRNLEATAARLASQGARLVNEPRQGAGGHRYIFVHPASTGGVLLELIEESLQA